MDEFAAVVLGVVFGFVIVIAIWLVFAFPVAWILTGVFNLTNISFLANLGFWQVYWVVIATRLLVTTSSSDS